MVVFVRVAAILAVLLALSDLTVARSRRSADDEVDDARSGIGVP